MAGKRNSRQDDVTAPVKSIIVLVLRTKQADIREPKCNTRVIHRKTISGSFLYVYLDSLVCTLRLHGSSPSVRGTGFKSSLQYVGLVDVIKLVSS